MIQTILSRQLLSVIMGFRYLYETWSGPKVKDEKHLAIASLNSWLVNSGHSIVLSWGNLFRNLVLIEQFSAKLYQLCQVFHRKSRVLHSWSSNIIVSIAGRNFFYLVHEIPWSLVWWGNFVYFLIEEFSFGFANSWFEHFLAL